MKSRLCCALMASCAAVALSASSLLAVSNASAAPLPANHAQKPAALSAYQQGTQDLAHGRYAAAEKAFRLSISRHQNLAQSWAGLGNAQVGLRQYASAFKSFQKAVKLAPRNADYRYRAGYAALYSNDFHAAFDFASGYIRLRPHDYRGYHLRFLADGSLLDGKAQVVDASFESRIQSNSADAFDDLGIALTNTQKFKKAINAFSRAITLRPGDSDYYSNRGVAEYQLKSYAPALHDFQKALSLTKDKIRRGQLTSTINTVKRKMHKKGH